MLLVVLLLLDVCLVLHLVLFLLNISGAAADFCWRYSSEKASRSSPKTKVALKVQTRARAPNLQQLEVVR